MPDDLYRLPFSASPEAPRRCHSEFWYRRRRAHRIETRRTPCDAGSGAAAHHGRILVGPASLPDSLAAGGTPAILNQASFLGAKRRICFDGWASRSFALLRTTTAWPGHCVLADFFAGLDKLAFACYNSFMTNIRCQAANHTP